MGHEDYRDLRALKNEQRRQQVIDAAAACFRERGFHGSSIANISRAAGMSPGHIYYHFADKEAIVEALVERWKSDLSKLLDSIEADTQNTDIISVLIRHLPESIERNMNIEHVQLMLEIAAESARNPRVADILRRSEQALQQKIQRLLKRQLNTDDLERVQALQDKMIVIPLMLNGLALRAPIHHEDKDKIIPLIEGVVTRLLTSDELLNG